MCNVIVCSIAMYKESMKTPFLASKSKSQYPWMLRLMVSGYFFVFTTILSLSPATVFPAVYAVQCQLEELIFTIKIQAALSRDSGNSISTDGDAV